MQKPGILFLLMCLVYLPCLSSEPDMPKTRKPRVLIICTGNSCRSQMAEGWGNFFWANKYDFFSAGVEKKGLNQKAVMVMKEAGVNIASQTSKLISELPTNDFDLVVTVCSSAREHCPVFPAGVKVIHHEFDDPPQMEAQCKTEEGRLAIYRRVRDEIKAFMKKTSDLLEPTE